MVWLKILFLPDDHLTEQYIQVGRYPTKISYQTLRKFGRVLVVAGWLVMTSFLMFYSFNYTGRQAGG